MFNLSESLRMLDTFSSVGVRHFDVTFLDLDGQKRGFRAQQSVRQLYSSLPKLLPGLAERQNSLIVRPVAEEVTLVQLDDLNSSMLEYGIKSVAFLILATSPGNHQAWVAVSGASDAKDFARRLRKGTGADLSASGATRIAGCPNYKRKYEPGFPTVEILSAFPGRIVKAEQLEALGLVAAPGPVKVPPFRVSASGGRSWPDYERCVQGAPLNRGQTGPDISRADFFWALMACQRGWSTEEVAARLMELSTKAQENGEQYARITVENAAAAVARNWGRNRA